MAFPGHQPSEETKKQATKETLLLRLVSASVRGMKEKVN